MSFFEVSGWTVSSAPIKDVKKRKRLSPGHDTEKNHGVEVNFEKLMAKMGKIGNEEGERKKKKAKHETAPRSQQAQGRSSRPKKDNNEATHNSGRKGAKLARATAAVPAEGSASAGTSPSRERQSKKRAKGKKAADDQNPSSAKATLVPSKPQEGARAKDELTALQSGMKSSLDGARFRWINETLYKSDSNRAHSMMREDPSIFREYHKGFRHQVESWPENPVSHYISTLSSYPPKTVVADLGCGDAALARTLIPNGFTVFSFDLVTDGVFVTEADIFGRLPLPGSEELDGREGLQDGQGQVVDVVICALSLMGTNWPNCIREAWRILRSGGELRIAEVTSRFTDVDAFESLITSMGFKMRSKDDRNTHFILFEFTKAPRRPKSQKEWGKLLSQSNLLKPCEYKRR